MTQKLFTLFVLMFAAIGVANAQDTIMLMKGKRIVASNSKVEVTAKGDTVVTYQDAKGKAKSKRVDRIFSISNASGEQVFYVPDTLPDELTVEQMRFFLNGCADYRRGFCWWAFLGGVWAGEIGAMIPPIEFNDKISGSIHYGILVPSIYLGVVANTTRSAEKIKKKNPQIPDNEYYIAGAQYALAHERFRSGAYGVLAGWIPLAIMIPIIDSTK
ncbi:MAG: hypothetical protein J6U04_01130 [Salinivirgaceae bacterium]|nr:hypothetical protein [Salinivirgaceae bacterium]